MRGNNVKFSEKYRKIADSKQNISIAYAYEIFITSERVLLLNSSDKVLTISEKKFLPFSGVSLVKGEFNDSADNVITLNGVFETQGITREMNLAGCKIKIHTFFNGELSPLVTYYIQEFEKNNLDFVIKCGPETAKYNQSLLLLFSKTCRANFGDSKCSVNTDTYKRLYQIESIVGNVVNVQAMDVDNGYYNLGRAFFEIALGNIVSFKITTHYGNRIELEEAVSESLYGQTQIRLMPTCDKNFRTCCNKFNNAVNFRGEPTIMEHNLLKVNVE